MNNYSEMLIDWAVVATILTLYVKSRIKSQNVIMRKQASKFNFYH